MVKNNSETPDRSRHKNQLPRIRVSRVRCKMVQSYPSSPVGCQPSAALPGSGPSDMPPILCD